MIEEHTITLVNDQSVGQVLDFEKFRDFMVSAESSGGVTGSVRVKVGDNYFQLKPSILDNPDFIRLMKAGGTDRENYGEVIASRIARAMLITNEKPFEAAPEVSLVYDKVNKRTPVASKYLKGDKVRTLNDFIKEQPATKYTPANNRHVTFVDGTKVKVKPGQYDISGEENKVLRQDIARGIAVSIVTGDHDVNPGNFVVVTSNGENRVARIDFGHAINDLLNAPEEFGGGVRNKDNQVLDFLNREKLADIKFGSITKLWRDYPGMIPTQEMADAFKELSQSKEMEKGVEAAREDFLALLEEMQKNNDIEGIAHLKNSLIAINNNISANEINPDIKIEPDKIINQVFDSICAFALENQRKMGDVSKLMQLQVNIDKMLEAKKRGYPLDAEIDGQVEESIEEKIEAKIAAQIKEIEEQYAELTGKPGIGLGKNKIRWIKTDANALAYEGDLASYIQNRSQQLIENSKELVAFENNLTKLNFQKRLEEGHQYQSEKEKVADILGWAKVGIWALKYNRDARISREKDTVVQQKLNEDGFIQLLDEIYNELNRFHEDIQNRSGSLDFNNFVVHVNSRINFFIRALACTATDQNQNEIKSACDVLNKFALYAGLNDELAIMSMQAEAKFSVARTNVLSQLDYTLTHQNIFLTKFYATLNRTTEVFKKVAEPISSITDSKSILLDKRRKITEGMTYLYQERKTAVNHKQKNKNLIEFYDHNIQTLHGLYGKINQMLYFDRSMTGINDSHDNLFTPLESFFSDAQSQQTQNKEIVRLEDFIIHNIQSFNIHENEWKIKPAAYDLFSRDKRHAQFEKQTHAEIYGKFNDKNISAKDKALQIRQLVNKRKPNILQFWRKEERLRYEEMGLKAELLCLLDGFAKGEFCELGLKNAVEQLLRVYSSVKNTGQLNVFIERIKIMQEANKHDNRSSILLENLLNSGLSQSAQMGAVLIGTNNSKSIKSSNGSSVEAGKIDCNDAIKAQGKNRYTQYTKEPDTEAPNLWSSVISSLPFRG